MKVILKENVTNLGQAGDLVKVADGYARNFLFPKGLAEQATPQAMSRAEEYRNKEAKRALKEKESAQLAADQIAKLKMTKTMKAGEKGKLFGSVTSADIAEFLKTKGFDVDRKKIVLTENIKSLGEHKVEVKIHKEVSATVIVEVIEEEEE